MKRAAIAISAVLIAGLIAGCAPSTQERNLDEPAPSSSAPLVAESPAASADEGEQAFLDYVRANLPANTVIPDATDEQLLAAGAEACERMAAGEDTLTMSVIEGEEPNGAGSYNDSAMIVTGAAISLCD